MSFESEVRLKQTVAHSHKAIQEIAAKMKSDDVEIVAARMLDQIARQENELWNQVLAIAGNALKNGAIQSQERSSVGKLLASFASLSLSEGEAEILAECRKNLLANVVRELLVELYSTVH